MNSTVRNFYCAGAAMVLGGMLACATPALAQTQSRQQRDNTAYNDEQYVRGAAEFSMSEVDFGKLAEQKAQDPQVKKFAQTMVDEHSKLTQELKDLGAKEGIRLPTSDSRKHADIHRQLQRESGANFDKSYAQQVTSDLEQEISEFKTGASAATKPGVKQFFERNSSTLESELQQAKNLAAHAR